MLQQVFTRRGTRFLACSLFYIIMVLFLLLSENTAHATSAVVNIYDNAKVLDAAQVEKAVAAILYNLDLYMLTTSEGDVGQLAQYARQHITTFTSGMIVLMIDTITDQQYKDAYQAFRHAIGTNNYTAATIAALQSLEKATSQNGLNILWAFLGSLLFSSSAAFLPPSGQKVLVVAARLVPAGGMSTIPQAMEEGLALAAEAAALLGTSNYADLPTPTKLCSASMFASRTGSGWASLYDAPSSLMRVCLAGAHVREMIHLERRSVERCLR